MFNKYPNKKNLPHSQETPMAKKQKIQDNDKQTPFFYVLGEMPRDISSLVKSIFQ